MTTQYRDGTFSPIKLLPEAMKTFNKALEEGKAKAFHIGSIPELEEVQVRGRLEVELEELKKRVDEIEGMKSDLIIIPTKEEIGRFKEKF